MLKRNSDEEYEIDNGPFDNEGDKQPMLTASGEANDYQDDC